MDRNSHLGIRLPRFLKRNKDKSRNATPTPSRATPPNPTSVANSAAGNHPTQDIGATVLDTLDTALKVLKEASVPLPPLQAAVGGICECFNIYKSVSGNTEQLQSLAKDLTFRTKFLEPYLSPENLGSSNQAVQVLKDHLNAIDQEVKQQQSSGLLKRTVRSGHITGRIQEFKTKVQDAYEQCKIEVLFSAERNTAEILKEFALGKMEHSARAYHDADMGLNLTRRLCCPGTRKNILADIEKWAMSSELESVPSAYWIWGMAGTGKSTIAMSICDILKEKKVLAGTFFCSRQIPECRDYRLIIPTLAYHLASFSKTFAMSLGSVLSGNLDPTSKKPDYQVKALLIEPWKAVIKSGNMVAHIPLIVIDALDECEGVHSVLKPLILAIQEKEFPGLRFLFTSRPEQAFQQLMLSESQLKTGSILEVGKIILHEVEKSQVETDILTYVTKELGGIPSSKEQLQRLATLSGALFIYASTVVKFVKEGDIPSRQKKRLKEFLEKSENLEDLDQLYVEVIKNGIPKKRRSGEAEEDWNIMRTIIAAGCPVTCDIIAKLLRIETNVVTHLMEKLQAVFYISTKDSCIYSFHASFPQFLESGEGVDGATYQPEAQHLKLTNGCFNIMNELTFNICSLPSSFIADKDVPKFDEKVKECIGEALQYCCQSWSYHFIQCEIDEDVERLEKFLQAKGVYWLEAMSLLGLLAQCGEAMVSMIKYLEYSESTSKVRAVIRYLQNLLLQFSSGEVQGRTPHLYLSIMPLWPNSVGCMPKLTSVVRVEHLVVNQADTAILRGHDQGVTSVAFSPDGTRIVSGSGDKTVKIWDANTGGQIGDPLHGHDKGVNSVAFSPDGTRIVSGSFDKTVRIWDANPGAQIGDPLHGHDDLVNSVVFSPDGTRIVSGSSDKTVRIWDADTGAQIGDPLHGHDGWVTSVAFSPDGTRIVSASDDITVRIWDANTGTQIGDPLHGHDDEVTSVAFSPDGTRIVSGSSDKTVRIWDADTGAQIDDPLHGHDSSVKSVAFSPDGTRIVSGSGDKTLRIWDANTGAQIGDPLHGHDNSVTSVAFSPDGTRIVSGSKDRTVRVHCNSQSFQAHHYWSLSHNGWIKFPNSPPNVIWIPPQFHQLLWRPQNTCIILQNGYTKLSFLDCVYGEHWINCIELEE